MRKLTNRKRIDLATALFGVGALVLLLATIHVVHSQINSANRPKRMTPPAIKVEPVRTLGYRTEEEMHDAHAFTAVYSDVATRGPESRPTAPPPTFVYATPNPSPHSSPPEPSSIVLMVIGLLGLAAWEYQRRGRR